MEIFIPYQGVLFDNKPLISHAIELLDPVLTKVHKTTDKTDDGRKIHLPEGSVGIVVEIFKGELNDIYYLEFYNKNGYSIAIEHYYYHEITKINDYDSSQIYHTIN